MAAAATLMKEKGHRVTGADAAGYPPMSTYLEQEGISFTTHFDVSNLVPPPDLVVIGNALSRGNPELEAVLDQRVPFVSLPELLREELVCGRHSLVVSGTHGKTTSASLLAWVLAASGRDPSFFIGGIPVNFGKGLQWSNGQEVVLEGDEYDSAFFDKRPKFVHYEPELMVINNIEFDHADIYTNLADVERVFSLAPRLIPQKGLIVANGDQPSVRRAMKETFCPVEWFGMEDKATWQVREPAAENEGISFGLNHRGKSTGRLHLPILGVHNAFNAAAVYVSCHWLGMSHDEIDRGFRTFRGVRRRIQNRGVFRGVTVFEDFAHHPTAIAKTIGAIRDHFPGRSIWAVFEPRSNTTRRNVFQKELAEAFRGASRVIIGRVFRPDGIPPASRLNPTLLAGNITRDCSAEAHYISNVEEIVSYLFSQLQTGDIVAVMSNGAFEGLTERLIEGLRKER
jgi:UDP-N-acetylmuramate: L-alanyl-gamma-D-glutamyl-meso-diaminopimelate ligase